MAPDTVWRIFRKFRLLVLALASILSLIWSVITAVYMAKNWSSYNSAERGFFFGLIAVDFIGSILLYLMIVVKYHFWPDAARTAVLLGLHVAGSVVLTIRSSSSPCNAFGSTANCHVMTMIVTIGSWVISALLAAYAICLPVMVFIPRPPDVTREDEDLENPPAEIREETRGTHASSASLASLLKNSEGMSPEVLAAELPIPQMFAARQRTHSHGSSMSSPPSPQVDVNRIGLEAVNSASVYPDLSRFTFAESTRSLDNDLNPPDPLPATHSDSIPLSPLRNRFTGEPLDANRISVASSFESTYDSPEATPTISEIPRRTTSMTTGESSASVYSQSTAHPESTPAGDIGHMSADAGQSPRSNSVAMPDFPGRLSVHSMMASFHGHTDPQSTEAVYDTTSNGFLSPPLTALPTQRFPTSTSQTSFELHLSNSPKRESEEIDDADLVTVHGGQHAPLARPGLNHVRTDSTSSNVDLDEWRKLVLTAAGREC